MIRIIAGTLKGRRLETPDWEGLRPTSDRLRETLFNVLGPSIEGSRVIDAYAGTGAVGIEALSRGAERCDFVERDAANVAVIRDNLKATGLADSAKVHRLTVERAAGRLEGPYTLVLADPPYDDADAFAALATIAASGAVEPDATTLVFELSSREEAPGTLGPLRLAWKRRYGDTQVAVYRSEGP